jgi:hypothetical protein
MHRPHLVSSLVCAAALLALSPAADPLDFHPADGSEANKHFALEGDFELDDLTMMVDGQDMTQMMGDQDVSGDFTALIEIVDNYVKTVDGKPIELRREYVESSAEWSMVDDSGTNENLSDLDGETLVFKWNDEAKKYDVTYADGEGDPEKLTHEGIDLDYRTLLPGKEVAAGDRWTVERDGMVTALFFGLEVSQIVEQMQSEDMPPEMAGMVEEILPEFAKLFDNLKGECEYAGTRTEGETPVGAIKLTLKSEGTADLASALAAAIEAQVGEQGVEVSIGSAALTLTLEGQGELLWNTAAGRAHGFAFEGDAEIGFDFDASITDPGGQEHTAEMGATFVSHLKWTMTTGKSE